ncbi:hypothetical protein OK016_29735 [Vibrio chagasii]|nr:hypothetical protein [Vibrio chagasii]
MTYLTGQTLNNSEWKEFGIKGMKHTSSPGAISERIRQRLPILWRGTSERVERTRDNWLAKQTKHKLGFIMGVGGA